MQLRTIATDPPSSVEVCGLFCARIFDRRKLFGRLNSKKRTNDRRQSNLRVTQVALMDRYKQFGCAPNYCQYVTAGKNRSQKAASIPDEQPTNNRCVNNRNKASLHRRKKDTDKLA